MEKKYAIVNEHNIIENIIVCEDDELAKSIGAIKVNDDFAIGDLLQEQKEEVLSLEDKIAILEKKIAELIASAELLGVLYQEPEWWFKGNTSDENDDQIEALINARLEAKKNKDWARADAIRNELKEQGIILEDSPQGTTWKRIQLKKFLLN